jgi:hypothetical protein
MTVSLRCTPTAYFEDVADVDTTWPEAGLDLIDELARTGRVGLIVGSPGEVQVLIRRLRDDLGLTTISLGQALCDRTGPPSIGDIEAALDGAGVLDDIDLLFAPALHVDVLSFLVMRSRRMPTIAVWPGEIVDRRARYSVPPRPDHQEAALTGAVILRPTQTRFPDEVPFKIERISR